ncbi:MAG: ABC transporter permease [Candidatus Odinarchaeia archaeon]
MLKELPAPVKIGILLIALMVSLSILAPLLTAYDPSQINLNASFEPPSLLHLFGTDALGRDMFSRLLYGGCISLFVSFISVSGGLIFGLFFGLISAYFGGKIDAIIMRIVDVFLSFPSIILAIALAVILGEYFTGGITSSILTLVIISVPPYTRLVRSSVMSIKKSDYIKSAEILGVSKSRILLTHMLPNILPPILTQAVMDIGSLILALASLGFLGIGVQPPYDYEWGRIIAQNLNLGVISVTKYPWLIFFPSLMIILTVLGWTLLGEGLNEFLNPHLRISSTLERLIKIKRNGE